MKIKTDKIYSPNFNLKKRKLSQIKYIIIHYTGMVNERKAIEKLTNIQSEVACHYFIKTNGGIIKMVPELYSAWHAGRSYWKNLKSLNKDSIGIEIRNPGHNFGYKNFKKNQITSLINLIKLMKKKFKIKSENILGHSDISPKRKKDPGEKFPWKLLAKKKLAIWHKVSDKTLKAKRGLKCNTLEIQQFKKQMKKIGYRKANLKTITLAFQRRFRPQLINGLIDKESFIISKNIVFK